MGIATNRKKRRGNTVPCTAEYTQNMAEEIDNARDKVLQLAEQEANRIMAEARARAERISKEAVAKAEDESAKYLTKLMRKAEQEVTEFEEEARTKVLKELDQCAGAISKARQILRQVTNTANEATEKESEHLSEVTLHPNLVEEKIETDRPISHVEALYHGEVELEVKSSGDFGQVGRFIECLRKVPNMELKSLGTFVQGKTTAILAIAEPLRLLSVLKQMPLVEEVLLSISEMGHILNRTLWHNQAALASSLRPRL